ncbi:MAG TPA: peptidylprolyl isomerase, partial [Acidilobales archaeon]|nr:peptidylprolyl isomerase [Acidilobales archaeon]
MPLSDGDIVLVDYSIFVKGTGELVETTSEAVAKL